MCGLGDYPNPQTIPPFELTKVALNRGSKVSRIIFG